MFELQSHQGLLSFIPYLILCQWTYVYIYIEMSRRVSNFFSCFLLTTMACMKAWRGLWAARYRFKYMVMVVVNLPFTPHRLHHSLSLIFLIYICISSQWKWRRRRGRRRKRRSQTVKQTLWANRLNEIILYYFHSG